MPAAPRKPRAASAAAKKAAASSRQSAQVAAAFDWTGSQAGIVRPVWMAPSGGGLTMIDLQKGRNNYYKMDVRQQVSVCRRMAARNWFLNPVLNLRHAAWSEDFRAIDATGANMREQYAFADLVSDIFWEYLISTNVVCMWRKGEKLPFINVLDAEAVEYSTVGGKERIVVQYSKDEVLARDKANEADFRKILGNKVYEAQAKGTKVTIIKGMDEEWDFETLIAGKRRGVFTIPEMVPILDTVDFMELMGIGDWNLAWARKDVIRLIKKGYKVTHGQGSGINSVDISKQDIKNLGEGFAKISGNANVPANHDVDPSYLTVPSDTFDPKQVDASTDRLLHWGGIEAVVLFGAFSQQNGAAPSLMRNARTLAFSLRERVEGLLRRIFSADEFKGLDWGGDEMRFRWGVKSLYSLDELLNLAKSTNDGTASPQTRREWLGLDNQTEVDRHKEAHADRPGYAPPFEAGQALLPAMFEDLAPADATPTTPGEPGRPANISQE
jgi:hypothetical protein